MIEFQVGDKVKYLPRQGGHENGIVKKLHPDGDKAWVVYKCGGNWDDYQNYTGALTGFDDLGEGWL